MARGLVSWTRAFGGRLAGMCVFAMVRVSGPKRKKKKKKKRGELGLPNIVGHPRRHATLGDLQRDGASARGTGGWVKGWWWWWWWVR